MKTIIAALALAMAGCAVAASPTENPLTKADPTGHRFTVGVTTMAEVKAAYKIPCVEFDENLPSPNPDCEYVHEPAGVYFVYTYAHRVYPHDDQNSTVYYVFTYQTIYDFDAKGILTHVKLNDECTLVVGTRTLDGMCDSPGDGPTRD